MCVALASFVRPSNFTVTALHKVLCLYYLSSPTEKVFILVANLLRLYARRQWLGRKLRYSVYLTCTRNTVASWPNGGTIQVHSEAGVN